MQLASVAVARMCAPGLDRLGDLVLVRPEIARQGLEEGALSVGVEIVIPVEHLARHRGTGSLAAARQQRLAELDQAGGVRFGLGGVAAAEQDAAALGNR